MSQNDKSETTIQLAELDARQVAVENEYRRQKRVLLETGIKVHTLRRDWDAVANYELMLLGLMGEAEHCRVSGCFAIRGQSHSGLPPCQQNWAGDQDTRSDYLRHCILRKS